MGRLECNLSPRSRHYQQILIFVNISFFRRDILFIVKNTLTVKFSPNTLYLWWPVGLVGSIMTGKFLAIIGSLCYYPQSTAVCSIRNEIFCVKFILPSSLFCSVLCCSAFSIVGIWQCCLCFHDYWRDHSTLSMLCRLLGRYTYYESIPPPSRRSSVRPATKRPQRR